MVSARYGLLDAMLQAERRERQGLQADAGAASTSEPAAAAIAAGCFYGRDGRDAGTSASTSGKARAARPLPVQSLSGLAC